MSLTKTVISKILKNPKDYASQSSIKDLEKALRYFSKTYYNTGTSIVSDEIFDFMKNILKERDPTNIFLDEIGAPVTSEKNKVKLPYFMGSLDKIKPDSDLKIWLKKYKGPYVLSDKIDGASAQLYKNNDGKVFLYSRGNGKVGQDITHLLQFIVDKENIDKLPNNTAIRGELVMTKADFLKIQKKLDLKNARNTVSGIVNSKTVDKQLAKYVKFVTYSVMSPALTQEEQMKFLSKHKFTVVEHKISKDINQKSLSEYLINRRANSAYEIDGIVVIDSSEIHETKEENPDYGFAFKAMSDDQIAESIITDVTWSVSMHGFIKPTVQIEPINISGVTIKNVTAYNAKFVKDNMLGPGAVIKIIRSGDVIPKIIEVIKPAKEAKMPDIPYKWNSTNVDVIVKDIMQASKETRNDIIISKITHFFEKLGVQNLGEGIVTKLVNNGYNTIQAILSADKDELTGIDGLGETSINKIYDNIHDALKNTNLYTFMAASHLFGVGVGERKLKLVIDLYPNIMNEKWTKKEIFDKVRAIEGYADITTNKFVDNFDEFKKFYNEINKIIDISHIIKPPKKIQSDANKPLLFQNMTIVFTGFRNKDWEKYINGQGGKISTSVSKNTSIVVYATEDSTGSKIVKAKNLGIQTMNMDAFKTKFNLN
jgi:DNA ligase (NAD+)